jgi:uncharacterized membrane protein YjgN (DUF898 family)
LRGLLLWLLVVGPLVIALVAVGAMLDWDALNDVVAKGDDDAMAKFAVSVVSGRAFAIGLAAIGTSILATVLLYPLFQAMLLRWWISGLRFGAVAVVSRLRTAPVYRVYLRFIFFIFLLALAAVIVGAVGLYAIGVLLGPGHDSNPAELAATAIFVGLYVTVALGASTIYQVVVTLAMWRLGAQSAELSGAQALDSVRAEGVPASALGEGLADALGVGGI